MDTDDLGAKRTQRRNANEWRAKQGAGKYRPFGLQPVPNLRHCVEPANAQALAAQALSIAEEPALCALPPRHLRFECLALFGDEAIAKSPFERRSRGDRGPEPDLIGRSHGCCLSRHRWSQGFLPLSTWT